MKKLKLDKPDQEIYGFFDGEWFCTKDGNKFYMPPNYASKSKLLEGDELVLRFMEDGGYIYKQIGPKPYKIATGHLNLNKNHYIVEHQDKVYKVLTASVTFYKLNVGDKVIIRVPLNEKAKWVAIESPYVNIINTSDDVDEEMNYE